MRVSTLQLKVVSMMGLDATSVLSPAFGLRVASPALWGYGFTRASPAFGLWVCSSGPRASLLPGDHHALPWSIELGHYHQNGLPKALLGVLATLFCPSRVFYWGLRSGDREGVCRVALWLDWRAGALVAGVGSPAAG